MKYKKITLKVSNFDFFYNSLKICQKIIRKIVFIGYYLDVKDVACW